jgi:hypothetical protein
LWNWECPIVLQPALDNKPFQPLQILGPGQPAAAKAFVLKAFVSLIIISLIVIRSIEESLKIRLEVLSPG